MPRSVPFPPAATAARELLAESDRPEFDRLAGALLSSAGAPLGPLLRAQLPGTAGVRWLRQEQLPPTTRPPGLTAAHWLSLYECWSSVPRAPGPGAPLARRGGRPSARGHAAGAAAIPRWGQ